nr:MAG TPA: hypothetical protein [Caudoviricetes sp.]
MQESDKVETVLRVIAAVCFIAYLLLCLPDVLMWFDILEYGVY